jgi:hypothetical protein
VTQPAAGDAPSAAAPTAAPHWVEIDAACERCNAVSLEWRNCKLICRNCRAIVKSCADL